jgi:hypothetical protein
MALLFPLPETVLLGGWENVYGPVTTKQVALVRLTQRGGMSSWRIDAYRHEHNKRCRCGRSLGHLEYDIKRAIARYRDPGYGWSREEWPLDSDVPLKAKGKL